MDVVRQLLEKHEMKNGNDNDFQGYLVIVKHCQKKGKTLKKWKKLRFLLKSKEIVIKVSNNTRKKN